MPYTPAGVSGFEETTADPTLTAAEIRRAVQILEGARTGRIRPGQIINVDFGTVEANVIQSLDDDVYSNYASANAVRASIAQYADFITFQQSLGNTEEVGFWGRRGTLYRFLDNTMEKVGSTLDNCVEKTEALVLRAVDWLGSTYEEKCQICDRGGELTCDGCGMTICLAEVRHITDELDFCDTCSLNWEGKDESSEEV